MVPSAVMVARQVEFDLQVEELQRERARADKQLQELETFYEGAPAGYLSLSADGAVLRINQRGADMLEESRESLVSRLFSHFVTEEWRAEFQRFLLRVFRSGGDASCDVMVRRASGVLIELRLLGAASVDGLSCRLVMIDITGQHRSVLDSVKRLAEWESLFAHAPEIVIISGYDGTIRRVNPAFRKLLGWEERDLLQHGIFHFVHPADREESMKSLDELRSGKACDNMVTRVSCADGGYRWLEWCGVASREGWILATARDVTSQVARKEALRISEFRMRGVFEVAPHPMLCFRLEEDRLMLTEANAAAVRDFGADIRSRVGLVIEEAFPLLVDSGVPPLYCKVARGEELEASFESWFDHGTVAGWFGIRVERISPGEILVSFDDITERMKLREELRKNVELFEERVAVRTEQLEERTRRLRALARELSRAEERERRRIAEFLHDDLQQLLVAASLRTKMLASLPQGVSSSDLEEIAVILDDAIRSSRTLTAELFPMELQLHGISAVLPRLKEWCLETYGLNLDVEVRRDANIGNEETQVLFRSIRELLFNIVKHAGVKEAFLLVDADDEHLTVEVSDRGVGFDPAALSHGKAKAKANGNGFGLTSVKERVEALGGTFAINSSPNHGSCFRLGFAVVGRGWDSVSSGEVSRRDEVEVPANAEGSGVDPTEEDKPGCIRVVVADDHNAVRRSLIRLLGMEQGIRVVGEAVNGAAAVNLALRLRPDIVLMDVNMPVMDGIKATAEIRARVPHVQVVGLSVQTDDATRVAMVKSGALELLNKTLGIPELAARLRAHMSHVQEGGPGDSTDAPI